MVHARFYQPQLTKTLWEPCSLAVVRSRSQSTKISRKKELFRILKECLETQGRILNFCSLELRGCNMLKYVMSLLVCACLMASPVLAGGGGGGAKKDATVRIVHDVPAAFFAGAGNTSVIVIADPPAALINKVNGVGGAFATPKDVTAAGGVIVKIGRTATLPVKSGAVRICAAVVLPNGAVDPITVDVVPVAKGATVTLNASAATPAGAW
jgi:hypothetical protein